jgi:hypothetical protein
LTVGLAPVGAICSARPVTRTIAVLGVVTAAAAFVHPDTDVPALAVARTR